ncbi:M1-specific T cell receptor alpha chain [Perca fluviatilis]|uniref:M1-specific T cell receptor alpha chain n=1 Tax=Perca fluviatilis TaxID=8168 RepID=UPI001962E4E0|nr:M1-specific T cell receptor alpha chain [Perca fluviatilis]
MIFGRGTPLRVDSDENLEPSVFKLSGTKTTACLATGFSRHNKTTTDPKQTYWGIFNKTAPAVRISGDSLYNQVAILSGEADEEQCEKSSPEPCDDTLKPDPKVNFVTLIVLGLRLLFLKTIAFNVLLTLRLWISQ